MCVGSVGYMVCVWGVCRGCGGYGVCEVWGVCGVCVGYVWDVGCVEWGM